MNLGEKSWNDCCDDVSAFSDGRWQLERLLARTGLW